MFSEIVYKKQISAVGSLLTGIIEYIFCGLYINMIDTIINIRTFILYLCEVWVCVCVCLSVHISLTECINCVGVFLFIIIVY